MGKAIAYLVLAIVGVLLLRATGLFDGLGDRGNPVADCLADDPASKGGTAGHPVVLELRFSLRDEKLETFATRPRVLQ